MNFFGRKKPAAAAPAAAGGGSGGAKAGNVQPGSALQNLKVRITALEKRLEFLEKKSQANLVEAKRQSQLKNKSGAMQALKRKKMHDKEVDKLRVAITNLEQQAFAIENASTTVDIISGMRAGHEAAKQIQKSIKVEDVEDLKDDITEQMQQQQEIDDILGNPLGNDMDDDDLLAELDELEEDEESELDALGSELGSVSVTQSPLVSLPKAPAGPVQVGASAVEDEDAQALAALEAEMAM